MIKLNNREGRKNGHNSDSKLINYVKYAWSFKENTYKTPCKAMFMTLISEYPTGISKNNACGSR